MKKINSTHPESQGPYVLIEDADFDPAIHTEYSEEAPSPKEPPPKKTGKQAAAE